MHTLIRSLAAFGLLATNSIFAQQTAPTLPSQSANNCAVTISNSSQTNVSCNGGNDGTIDISVLLDTTPCRSNTVVLNEIMHRPTLGNGSNPNAGEFIELIAPAGANIGCYVLTDGDWTITIPPNTIVPADGVYSIGNNAIYGAGTMDLDAENCACFTDGGGGGGLLILTDGGEYVSLHNNTGVFVQGLIYGTPTAANSPPNGNLSISGSINTAALAGCPAQVNIPAAAAFETITALANNGDSYQRAPDATGAWTLPTGNTINSCNAPSNAVYSVAWSNGISTEDISNLAAGIYTVSVTDGNGCSVVDTFSISQPSAVSISTISVQSTSCGNSNGAIQIAANGGVAPYSFLWSNNSTNQNLSGLAAGVYSLSLSDANGCETDYTQTISNPSAPTLTVSSVSVLCAGDATGQATVATTGGTSPFSFRWNDGQTTPTVTGLIANNYFITVTDALGCVAAASVSISQPTALTTAAVQTNDVSCFGFNNGGVNVAPDGGTLPYAYLWSNGATTQLQQNLPPDTYIVTISDANGCTISRFLDVLEPAPLQFAIAQLSDSITCDLLPTGELSAQIAGGTGAYSYAWSGTSQATATITGLGAGAYILTVSDANGCTLTGNYDVFAPVTIVVNAIIDSIGAQKITINNNTSVDFSVQNPVLNQNYTWTVSPNAGLSLNNNMGTNNGALATAAGTYLVVINAFTANGCSDSDTLLVEVVNPFLGMPSAFSPNGDGINDLYRPVSLASQYIKSFQLFNRWGAVVYESASLENGGWNGELNGEKQPRDSYIYTLTYQLPNQNTATILRGEFTLIR